MEFNYIGVIKWMLIGIAMMVLCGMVIQSANASEIVVEYPDLAPLDYIPRIEQGDMVYINDTVDISGVSGWPGPDGEYRLAYYGQWVTSFSPEDLDPKYILILPGKTHSLNFSSQYRYWMDPEIFYQRPGWWYQWSSNLSRMNNFEAAGNLRAFYVKGEYRSLTVNNNTSAAFYPGQYVQRVTKPDPLLPEKHITDFVVARGDNLTIAYPGTRLWVFGREEGIYNDTDASLMPSETWGLEEGKYTLLIQGVGNNTLFDVRYDNDTLIPALYGNKPVDIRGYAAPVVFERLGGMLGDDVIETYRMQVEDPYITIDQADEVWSDGKAALDVRGYTNVQDGTAIFVNLDEGRTYRSYIRERNVSTVAVRTFPGNLSYYRAMVPVEYDTLVAANALNHTITARTAIGGVNYADFWISVMPADSFRPNATLKYIQDRNPFVPTPTPVIQEKVITETVTVVQTVAVVQTPDVGDYGKVAEGFVFMIAGYIFMAIVAIIAIAILLYAITVGLRAGKK